MKKTTTGILFLLLLLSFSKINAQDKAWDVMEKLYGAYGNMNNVSFEAHMKMYADTLPLQLMDKLDARCVLDKQQYFFAVGPIEMIRNNNYLLNIDHEDKTIMVTSPQAGDQAKMLPDLSQMLRSVKENGVQAQLRLRENDWWLELRNMPDGIQECNIQYDPEHFYIRKLWMKAKHLVNGEVKSVIVDITYSKYQPATMPASFYSGSKYLATHGQKMVLQPAYKKYQLINQL